MLAKSLKAFVESTIYISETIYEMKNCVKLHFKLPKLQCLCLKSLSLNSIFNFKKDETVTFVPFRQVILHAFLCRVLNYIRFQVTLFITHSLARDISLMYTLLLHLERYNNFDNINLKQQNDIYLRLCRTSKCGALRVNARVAGRRTSDNTFTRGFTYIMHPLYFCYFWSSFDMTFEVSVISFFNVFGV